MKHNAFKRGNQKPGGRTHRSTRASREETLGDDSHRSRDEA